jgi:glycyl-tRNA synthetase
VDPEDKSHPKFGDISDLELLMFPREEQLTGKSATKLKVREAVSKVTYSDTSLVRCFKKLYYLSFF